MIAEILDAWSARASRWLYNLGVYGALPALLTLVTLEVVLRYLFNAPLQWSRDTNGLLLLITLFSALPRAWDQGYHIRMEIIYDRMPPRWRSVADVLSALTGFVFFSLLATQAVVFSRYMFMTDETGEDLSAPFWPFMVYVAICALVFAARLLANPSAAPASDENESSQWT